MPVPSSISPNTGNYQVGKGIVSFKQEGDATYRDLGNVTAMTMTPNVETLEHFSSREGTKKKDLVIVLDKSMTVAITMEEFTAKNIGLMLLGTVDETTVGGPSVEIFDLGSISGALRFVGTNEVGPKVTVDLWNVTFNPDGDFGLISDEWNNMELSGDVLVANTGDVNAGKFGTIQVTNVEPSEASALTSLTPATGVAAGGLDVTLTGTGFTDATGVTFGGVAATDFEVVNDTTITCTTPAHAAGTVAVVVQDVIGNGTLPTGFVYT